MALSELDANSSHNSIQSTYHSQSVKTKAKMPIKARVIGYIPLDRGHRSKSRMSKLLDVIRAKDGSDRMKKLVAAVKAFNHQDKEKHDADIKAGAVAIVCNILRSCSPFFISKSKEVQQLLKILLQLYRCNEERARASFCLDGSILIVTLLEVIEINYRLGKKGDISCLVLAQNVVDKLIHVARVPLTMVKHHVELLQSLINYITGVTGRLAIYHSIRCIATLAEHTQNKQAVLTFPNLMASVQVCARHMSESVRQEAARTMFQLAMEIKNKSQLTHQSNRGWMDVVLTLTTEKERSIEAKLYAINTLIHLATENDNKIIMLHHKDGFIITSLLKIARDVDSKSSSMKLSRQATKLLGSLACRATASRIGNHPGLLVTLSFLACGKDQLAVIAAMTIKKLATHIRSNDHCHANLLQALITMSYGKSTEALKWTVKAFVEQASFPHDRVEMIAHKGLLPALIMLTDDKNSIVRVYAQEALSALAVDVAKTKDMGVEKLIRCVMANKPCNHEPQPRCYSPTSVANFAFFE